MSFTGMARILGHPVYMLQHPYPIPPHPTRLPNKIGEKGKEDECRQDGYQNVRPDGGGIGNSTEMGPMATIVLTISGESKTEDEPQAPLYDICKTALTAIFQPKKNYTYERHVFRSLSQKEGETIIQFVTRLKAQSANCNFRNNADDMIIDQLIEKYRAKELGRIFEGSEKQAGRMEAGSQDIRRVEKKVNTKRPPKAFKCYRCDGEGHRASDEKCPARNKTCNKCGLIGHLGKCCRTKKKTTEQGKRIRNVETGDPEDIEYAFQLQDEDSDLDSIQVLVGGVKARFFIDSGATCNVIDKKSWENLKASKIKGTCGEPDTKKLYSYGRQSPLKTLGTFHTTVELENGSQLDSIKFYVVDVKATPIIGKSTARTLGILRTGHPLRNVSSIEVPSIESLCKKFPNAMGEGIGKLHDYSLKIASDEKIQPLAQTGRRIPFQLRPLVKGKLRELIESDIIEKVNEPARWVSPVVCTTKKNEELRMCVDMRAANEVIIQFQ
ncbi:uncharacterized protein LOC135145707 [Zophobas morio]|uniref:uncharacterized protein LOC135145707 n=1 Tax=Zophobas morio TaxID=2755281 RepID=UPI003083BF9D